LRTIGVPAISLKKYYAAGIQSPEDFCRYCLAQNRPVPQKVTRAMLERGRAELLTIPGLGETTIEKLYSGGVINSTTLASADPAARHGPVDQVRFACPDRSLKVEGDRTYTEPVWIPCRIDGKTGSM